MSMRPVPARWFEALVATEDLVKSVEALARSGDVELEVYSETTQRVNLPNLRDRFEEYDKLLRRYQPYWPQELLRPSTTPGRPDHRLDAALARLAQWQNEADPAIDKLEVLLLEQEELTLLLELLEHMDNDELDFSHAAAAGPALAVCVFALPPDARVHHLPPAVLSIRVPAEQHLFLLAVGNAEVIETLARDLAALKGRAVRLPTWLGGRRLEARQQVTQRQEQIRSEAGALYADLAELEKRHALHEVLGDIEQMEWFVTHVTDLPVSENFAWITGWTSDVSENRIQDILHGKSVRGVVRYPPAPAGVSPPMVFLNPAWSRPFEFFARLMGVPAADELDPSIALSVIVPLIFGYMFGDVGHGLVFMVIGVVFRDRWPLLRILIGCGLSSMVFGWLFGSVFASEQIIAPLWVHPIEAPLQVLLVPMAAGVVILLLGLLANGVQRFWQGEWRRWCAVDAAVVVMYLSIIGAVADSRLWAVFPVALAWYLAGSAVLSAGPVLKTLGSALGLLTETLLQLLINTVSFIRVGAFALAHAGLSLAVFIMATTFENTVVATGIFILGNVVILVLEGLVVSIQTTRLILFEFFIRFLTAQGRMFRPLSVPGKTAAPKPRRM